MRVVRRTVVTRSVALRIAIVVSLSGGYEAGMATVRIGNMLTVFCPVIPLPAFVLLGPSLDNADQNKL